MAMPLQAAASRAFGYGDGVRLSRSRFCDGIQSIDVRNTRPFGETLVL